MDTNHRWNVSFKPLVIGLIVSILCIFTAYQMTCHLALSRPTILGVITALGIIQAFIQLIFFLHLGLEPKPRWNLFIFFMMVLLIAILMGGSIWIMNNLNYHMMPTLDP